MPAFLRIAGGAAAFCSLVLLFPICTRAQFEGVIEMRVTSRSGDSSQSSLYTMAVRKGMLAATVDRAGPQGGEFIFRADKGVLWIVNRSDESYLEIPTPPPDSASHGAGGKSAEGGSHFSATGRVDSILGYPCRELVADEGRVHVWATDRLGDVYESLARSFGGLGAGGAGAGEGGWEEELAAMKIFPLRLSSNQNGTVEEQEVTKIEPRRLTDDRFNPPPGFQKDSIGVDIESLLKKMMSDTAGHQ